MVAHVLPLRAALLVGAFRGDARHVVRAVFGFLVLVAATVVACRAVLTLQDAPTAVAQTVIVIAGSAGALGFAFAPLLTGVTDPLDPRRFTVFGLEPWPLVGALAVGSLISVPTFIVTALAVCAALVWTAHGVTAGVATVGAILSVLTCVLLARTASALVALGRRERRSRQLSGMIAFALLAVVVPVGVFLASLSWNERVPAPLAAAASALAGSPIGAAWAIPGSVASGADASSVVMMAVGTILVLGASWTALTLRALTRPSRPVTRSEHGRLGWFRVLPGTPGGVIAARSLMYWLRDRRYLVNIVIIPVMAAIATVPLLVAGVPAPIVALVPVPIIALFFGWLPHNDIAYDSSAIWMHVASGTRGFADRVGRLVPILLLGLPVLAVLIPLAVHFHGDSSALPAMVGLCASLFLSGLGFSSIASVVAPYPVTRPGDSPFRQPERAGSSGVIAQGLVLIGAIAVSIPVLRWGWLSRTEGGDHGSSALLGGLGIGILVLLVGLAIGSLVFDRSGGRLMEFAEAS